METRMVLWSVPLGGRTRSGWVMLVLCLGGGCLVGCIGDDGPQPECAANDDCAEGQVCQEGECIELQPEEEQAMSEVNEYAFACDPESGIAPPIEIPVDSEGEMMVRVVWSGEAESILVTLDSTDHGVLLEDRVFASPWELYTQVPGGRAEDAQQVVVLTIVSQGGLAQGGVLVGVPVATVPESKSGPDLDKGKMLTERPEDLYPKGQAPGPSDKGNTKRPADTPVEVSPGGADAKLPPLDAELPVPRGKIPLQTEEEPRTRFFILRMQLLRNELSVLSSAALPGALVTSRVVAGNLLWAVTMGDRVLAVDTFPDPRVSRVHLEDGSRREGVFEDRPSWFKVSIPEHVLDPKIAMDLTIELYEIPGELGLRRIDTRSFPEVRDRLTLLTKVEPAEVYRALRENPDLKLTEED